MTSQNLDLTDVSAGSGCACCSTGSSEPTQRAAGAASGVVATYGVAGMTCGHCVGSVAREIRTLDGVTDVDVTLVAGGTSRVTVTSGGPLDDDAIRAAVDEAGYDLTGRQA